MLDLAFGSTQNFSIEAHMHSTDSARPLIGPFLQATTEAHPTPRIAIIGRYAIIKAPAGGVYIPPFGDPVQAA